MDYFYKLRFLLLFMSITAFLLTTMFTDSVSFSSDFDNHDKDKVVIPAFPGAEGFGALSIGGRGGRVIEVTNLNNSGPGSLRSALKAEGPRTVVFRVAGIITLEDAIRLDERNSYLTIAGQTAPGGGILIRGNDNNLIQIQKGAHDIIIRYIRLRNGSGIASGSGHDNLTITGGYNIMIDHVSMSWSTDENLSMYSKKVSSPIYNVTVQRSIMAEGLKGHSNGLIISGKADYSNPDDPLEVWREIKNITLHHNLFIHNTHRNPRITCGGVQIINNITYNWKYRIGSSTRGSVYDNINNYARPGPMSNNDLFFLHESFSPERPMEKYPAPSIYSNGNIVESVHDDPNADDWMLYKINYLNTDLDDEYRRNYSLPEAPVPVTKHSAHQAYIHVLEDVGANSKVGCDGFWIHNPDKVDQRLLADVKNMTGPKNPVEHPYKFGGYPVITAGEPCIDSDHDGMPDSWEQTHDLNPTDPSDGSADADEDGYTNLEEYINGVVK